MEFLSKIWEFMIAVWEYHWLIRVSLSAISFYVLMMWSFQRNPARLVNGYMNPEKAKEFAPEIFGKPEKEEQENSIE